MYSTLVADSFVSLAAVGGLLILRSTLQTNGPSAWINRRFSFVISILVWMLGSRVLYWLVELEIFRIINLMTASFIPLAMLVLCEGLMRRHAHRLLKIWVVSGACVLALMSLIDGFVELRVIAPALMGFQAVSFVVIGLWVICRKRSDLTFSENRVIDRLAWSLLLIIPFAATDFRVGVLDSPVRLSGVAILFLCWLSLSLDRIRINHLQILSSLFFIVAGVTVAVAAITLIADLDGVQIAQAAAIILCTGLLLQIYSEAKAARREDERGSLLQYIADAEADDSAAFLRGIQDHPLVAGALILENKDLDDFDPKFREFLAARKLISAGQSDDIADPDVREQMAWLFEKYGASHAFYAGPAPYRIVVLNLPSIASSRGAELELALVQKVSELIGKTRVA